MSVCHMLNERGDNEKTGSSGPHKFSLNINIQTTEGNIQARINVFLANIVVGGGDSSSEEKRFWSQAGLSGLGPLFQTHPA